MSLAKFKWFLVSILLPLVLLISSCKDEKTIIEIWRFEQDLFNPQSVNQPDHFMRLQKKYGFFYNSFAEHMLNISEEEKGEAYSQSLSKFISFPGILQLKKEVDSVFPTIQNLEEELGEAMKIYRQEFPKSKAPIFVTYLSEFSIAHATTDSMVGIGLDFYLGPKYPLYPALEFPDFMVSKLRKEYMVPNTLKAFGIGKFEGQLTDNRFLAMMLFEGKIRYFVKTLIPEIPDTLLFGYSATQNKWARDNESMIWAHFIQSKMLYNNEPAQYMRYFNDGPFTIATGVPQESAPAIGVFAGYKIIQNYMRENKGVTLEELMLNNHWDEILNNSFYKP